MNKKGPVHPMFPVPDAIRIVLQETARLLLHLGDWTEELSSHYDNLEHLRGRTLAQDVVMREPGYPPYTASIMDGFAVNSSLDATAMFQEDGTGDWTHALADKVFAGDEPGSALLPKRVVLAANSERSNLPAAYYVTTGAVIPDTCDCVVPIEDVVVSDDQTKIRIRQDTAVLSPNKWIRAPGSDIAAGTTVLHSGSVLGPVALGLLLQSGVTAVTVRRTVTVGVLSTGSELLLLAKNNDATQDWWINAQHGTIPDVNRPVLLSLLSAIPNVKTFDLGMVRDDNVDVMVDVIQGAIHKCDVIVTTGGISMGETDIVEHVLVERLQGQLHFGRLHMKPGKPTTFVTIQNPNNKMCLVFAMPGNPVSAIVCTQLLVTPCLHLLTNGSADTTMPDAQQLHGASNHSKEKLVHRMVELAYVHAEVPNAELAHDVKLDAERPEYHRVTFIDQSSATKVTSTGVQQSSRLLSLRDVQGLLVLPQATAEHPVAKAGETYTLLLLDSNNKMDRGVQVCDSKHLEGCTKKAKKPLKIGIVQIAPDSAAKSDISLRVERALSGSKSGSVSITSSRVYSDPVDRFYNSIEEEENDILVIACLKVPGSFRHHVKLASLLRQNLSKVGNAMALQARRGAAAQDPTAALFEVVIGYRPDGKGSIVILLPEEGLDTGLEHVRGLLKHALQTARGDHDHGATPIQQNIQQ